MQNPWIDVQIPEGLIEAAREASKSSEEQQQAFLEENSDGTLGQCPIEEDQFLLNHREGWILLGRFMNREFPSILTRGVFETREDALTMAEERTQQATDMVLRLHGLYKATGDVPQHESSLSSIHMDREGNTLVFYATRGEDRVRLGWITAAWFDLDAED